MFANNKSYMNLSACTASKANKIIIFHFFGNAMVPSSKVVSHDSSSFVSVIVIACLLDMVP